MSEKPRSTLTLFGKGIRIVMPVAIFAGGVLLARHFISNPPKAERKPPAVLARLVEVEPVVFAAYRVRLRAMGEVKPAREIQLAAQVSGRVIRVSPNLIPGAVVKAGEVLVEIEDEDYRLALAQREASLEVARRDLSLEQGQNLVAARESEWSGLTPEGVTGELIRREPQLRAAEAAVASAEAAVEMAKLNVGRTQIRAPFDGVLNGKFVDVGSYLNPGAVVAGLAGTDAAWVEALLPADELSWLQFPNEKGEGGSAAFVSVAGNVEVGAREGRLIRQLSYLETEGRMARVLVEIRDPLALSSEAAPMFFGAYASLVLEGKSLDRVAEISRRHVRGGDRLYLFGPDNKLDIREVEIAYRGEETVLVSAGVDEGERLILTDLPVAVAGMALRLPGKVEVVTGARP